MKACLNNKKDIEGDRTIYDRVKASKTVEFFSDFVSGPHYGELKAYHASMIEYFNSRLSEAHIFTMAPYMSKSVREYNLVYFSLRIGNTDKYAGDIKKNRKIADKTEEIIEKCRNYRKNHPYGKKASIESLTDIMAEFSFQSKSIEDSKTKGEIISKSMDSIDSYGRFNPDDFIDTIKLISNNWDRYDELKYEKKDTLQLYNLVNRVYTLFSYSYLKFNDFKEIFKDYSDFGLTTVMDIIGKRILNIDGYYLKHKNIIGKGLKDKDIFSIIYKNSENITQAHFIRHTTFYSILEDKEIINSEGGFLCITRDYNEYVKSGKNIEELAEKQKVDKQKIKNNDPDIKYLRFFKDRSLDDFKKIFANMDEEYKTKTLRYVLDKKDDMKVENEIDHWLSDNYSNLIAKIVRTNIEEPK